MVALRGAHGGPHPNNYVQPPPPQAPQPPPLRMPHPHPFPTTHKLHNTAQPHPNINCVHPSHNNFSFISPQTHSIRYPRPTTPHQRSDCYHQVGAGGYMSGGPAPPPQMQQAGMRAPDHRVLNTQSPTHQAMNVHELKQPPMTHNFVPQQPTQPRPQHYATAHYRPAAAPRPTHRTPTHQQQLYQGGGAAGAPMMFPIMYPPHSVMQQQYAAPQRPACYPQHMTSLMNYCLTPTQFQQNQPPQQSYYYPTAPQPLLTTSLPSPATAPRPMNVQTGIAPLMRKKRSFAVSITDPVTGEDVFKDMFADQTLTLSGESSERQTPQPESSSVAEEFNRKVFEKLSNEKTITLSGLTKYEQPPIVTSQNVTIPPIVSIPSNNKSEPQHIEIKESQSSETPIVSAISDSPVIMPKLPTSKNTKVPDSPKKEVKPKKEEEKENSMEKHMMAPSFIPAESIERIEEAQIMCTEVLPDAVEMPPIDTMAPINTLDNMALINTMAHVTAMADINTMADIDTMADINTMAPLPQRVRKLSKKQDHSPPNIDQGEHAISTNGPTTLIEYIPALTQEIMPEPEAAYLPNINTLAIALQIKTEPKLELLISDTSPASVYENSITNDFSRIFMEPDRNTSPEDMEIELTTTQAKLYQNLAGCVKDKEMSRMFMDDEFPSDPSQIDCDIKPMEEQTNDYNKNQITANDLYKYEKIDIIEDINKNKENITDELSNNIVGDEEFLPTNETTNAPTIETEPKLNTDDADVNVNDETDSKTEIKKAHNANSVVFEKPIVKEITIAPEITVVLEKHTVPEKLVPVKVVSEKPIIQKPFPRYHYKKHQWSPVNQNGKKMYDKEFLLQLQSSPLAQKKPEHMNMLPAIMKSSQDGLIPLSNLSRQISEACMPVFAMSNPLKGPSRDRERDLKKSSMLGVKSASMKGPSSSCSSMSGLMQNTGNSKNVFHFSIQLRGDVKLNESQNAWKPARKIQNSRLSSQDDKTQEIYCKMRGILNKLTPENFGTLLEKVKNLEINTQDRLEGVIDLIFEKAIDEPSFSVTYANMCNKLSKIQVPMEHSQDEFVNFHISLLSRCKSQFDNSKGQELVFELENRIAETGDLAKKKELQLLLDEENRKMRMRSVGNVRFIGELYKLNMIRSNVMLTCLKTLIEKLEEEKLECLCKLLTTIGELLEQKARPPLDEIFANMVEIVDKKSHKISSRVRFMLQDVIELRRRRWATKNVTDAQPKTLDQIQKEAEFQQRQSELMNSGPISRDYQGGRDEGRNKRLYGRRGGPSNMDNWQHNQRTKYTVDTSKLKAATNSNKNLSNIKLGPPQHAWNHGSGAKPSLTASPLSQTLTNNMYSALENITTDPSILRGSKDFSSHHHSKGSSVERSSLNSRSDYSNNSQSSSSHQAHSNSSSRSGSEHMEIPPHMHTPTVLELSDAELRLLHSILDLHLHNPNDEEFADQLKQKFKNALHSKVIYELYCYALEKNSKTYRNITNSIHYSVKNHAISCTSHVIGYSELLELAPDLLMDYPKIYEYLAIFVTPFLISKHISTHTLMNASEKIISERHGHLFLQSILEEMCSLQGEESTKKSWKMSGCYLSDWMSQEQVVNFRKHHHLMEVIGEELEGASKIREPSPFEVHGALLTLMNLDRSCECIRRYIKDFADNSTKEDWFMRVLMQSVCEHALFGRAGEGSKIAPRLNVDRMSKYVHLVTEYGDKDTRNMSCLNGITQLLHRLEHPKGVTLEIFQYLSDHYIIQREGFLAFENSNQELEGKGVLMKALVSFYTNILEVDNEDSCSED